MSITKPGDTDTPDPKKAGTSSADTNAGTGAEAEAPTAEAAPDHDAVARALSAENKIKTYVIGAVTASIVPVPLFDLVAVVGIQLRMIQKLSHLYGKQFSDSAGRNIISGLAGGVVSYGGGYALAASASKLIPGVGWMLGMVSLPIVSGATTYALGRVLVRHFEGGGSLFDLSADTVRDYYKEQFEKGKKVAAKAKEDLTSSKQADAAA